MPKYKERQWAELDEFPHVKQAPLGEWMNKDHPMKGNWNKELFQNNHPIVLELGCGKGEYTVGLAERYPEKNFIGVDIKGHRMWRGAKTSFENNMPNVGFLRTRIDFITSFFEKDEVSEIWLTFSDPQPRGAKESKRLTSPLFISRYRKFLKPGGIIHVKTDSDLLYEYTLEKVKELNLELIQHTNDLYGELIENLDEPTREIMNIRTHYENIFLKKGIKIKYIKFKI